MQWKQHYILTEFISNTQDRSLKATLYLFLFHQVKDTLRPGKAALKVPAVLHNPNLPGFRVKPTNVKTECSVTASCMAVMSQAAGAVSPFGAERGKKEEGVREPIKTLTHHKTWRGGGADKFWGEEGEIGPISQFFHSGPDWPSQRRTTSVDVTLGHGDSRTHRAERKVTQLSGCNICTPERPSPPAEHVCTVFSSHSSERSDSVTWVRNRQRWDNKKRPGVGGVGNSGAERLPWWNLLLFSMAEKSSSHSRPAGRKKEKKSPSEHTVTLWRCVNSPQLP